MAVDPYTQKTGAPATRTAQPTVSTNVGDFGAALQRIGPALMQSQMPRLADEAARQAEADFRTLNTSELAKDAEGRYVVTQPPKGGGSVYRDAYEKASNNRIYLETYDDMSKQLNDLYYDPERFTRNPDEVRKDAEDIIYGFAAISPAGVREKIIETGLREFQQRDLQASNEMMRRSQAQTEALYRQKWEDTKGKLDDLHTLPPEQAQEEIDRLTEEFAVISNNLALFDGEELTRNKYNTALIQSAAYGEAFRTINQVEGSALELRRMYGVLNGAEGDIGGLTYAQMAVSMSDPQMQKLKLVLSSRITLESAEEAELARVAAAQADDISGGQGYLSDAEFTDGARGLAAANNIDLDTPEGVLWIAQNASGDIPAKHYKELLEDAGSQSIADLQKNLAVYMQLQRMPNPVDGSIRSLDVGLEAKDEAFYYHLNLALQNEGSDMATARQTALLAIKEGLTTETSERSFIAERMGKKMELLEERLDDEIGSWKELSPSVKRDLTSRMAQYVALNMPEKEALKLARQGFKRNWVKDEYSVPSGGTGDNWVPRDSAIPPAIVNLKGEASRDWIKDMGVTSVMATLAGKQREGVPPIARMTPGEDLFFAPAGLKNKKGQVFYAFYKGEGNIPIPLLGKDGEGPLLIDLGRAANNITIEMREESAKLNASLSEIRAKGTAVDQNNSAYNLLKNIAPSIGFLQKVAPSVLGNPEEQIRDQASDAFTPSRLTVEDIQVKTTRPVNAKVELDGYLKKLGIAESSGGTAYKNPESSASGLFQFIDSTWLEQYDKVYPNNTLSQSQKLALRKDEKVQIAVVKNFTAENAQVLKKARVPLTYANLYGAHFLGAVTFANMFTKASDSDSIRNWIGNDQFMDNLASFAYDRDPRRPKNVGAVKRMLERKMR